MICIFTANLFLDILTRQTPALEWTPMSLVPFLNPTRPNTWLSIHCKLSFSSLVTMTTIAFLLCWLLEAELLPLRQSGCNWTIFLYSILTLVKFPVMVDSLRSGDPASTAVRMQLNRVRVLHFDPGRRLKTHNHIDILIYYTIFKIVQRCSPIYWFFLVTWFVGRISMITKKLQHFLYTFIFRRWRLFFSLSSPYHL